MKIRKIKTIKGYKSFLDFEWSKFCKNASGQEETLLNFSIIFGENGAGKSAICDVLKSVSKAQDFQDTPPTLVEVEINDNKIYKYENGRWEPGRLDKNTFLFFDIDFINANVHTHGLVSSNLLQGAHTQKAGNLIIDLDETANNLKDLIKAKDNEREILNKTNEFTLAQQFTDKDQELFKVYKDVDEKTIKEKLTKAQEELKKLDADLATLQKLKNKHTEITKLSLVDQIMVSNFLSSKEIYTELFARQIKEKAQDEADVKIKAHFEKHKKFIETAKDQIPQDYKDENCPLCMQPLVNASRVIEYYRAAFDQSYDKAKQKYLTDIQTVISEQELVKSNLTSLPAKVISVFDVLEKVKTDFEIQDVYNLEEKAEFTNKFSNISIPEIDELIAAFGLLGSVGQKPLDTEKVYDTIDKKLKETENAFKMLNAFITTKNKIISEFKNKYSDQTKIVSEIQEMSQKQKELGDLIEFLKSDKVALVKKQNEVIAKQKSLSDELKKAQEDLKEYLANTIPGNVISQMISTLGKFSLSFTLEHIEPSQKTKDYSFSFRIKDQKGNERKFKDGLSEGERQLISLAFFFAINESLPNKQGTVLIFDDPITSLDSPNLKILAELIHKTTQEFAQVIVFTHHPLFFKYLSKCQAPNPYKFGVLKNADAFGGSFMFFDPGFDLTAEILKCNEEISQNAKNGDLKPEEIALKYGQFLRLAIEKFVKNDLLMWDKEKRFDEITENLKQGKNKIAMLSDQDLELMTNMYKYCNYSNLLHVDKEMPSALSELQTHIDKFCNILSKVKP